MAQQSWTAIGLTFAIAAGVTTVPAAAQAPSAGPNALYCLRIEAITGSRLEQVRCWTRDEWTGQGVDLDKEWPKEGVRVIER